MNHRTFPKTDNEAELPESIFPLTVAQSRIWFLDQLRPGDPSLNVAVRWELLGDVPEGNIETAFKTIISRHEILRTRLVSSGGVPEQQVLTSVNFNLRVEDLRSMEFDQRAARAEDIADEMGREPFELSEAPLIRVSLVRLAPEISLIFIVAHHSIFDGFSIGVLGNEFCTLLNAIQSGSTAELPELPLQYGDFALWQEQYLESSEVVEDSAYWQNQLSNMKYFEIPADFERPSVRSNQISYVYIDLPVSFGERLESAARKHEMSAFSFGVGILSVALQKFTGKNEVVFGTQIAGRDEVELENMIGVFINNLVLRLQTSPDSTIIDQLAHAKKVVDEGLAHRQLPFDRLVATLTRARDMSRNPLVSINFNLQRSTFLQNKRFATFELISRPSHSPGIVDDLNFLLIGRPNGWRMTLEYNSSLFKRETAQTLLNVVVETFELGLTKADSHFHCALQTNSNCYGETQSERTHLKTQASSKENLLETISLDQNIHKTQEPQNFDASYKEDVIQNQLEETENRLGAIWSQLLCVPQSECDSDFFELGGHSLLAMKMLANVEEEFSVKADVGTFLENPTLRGYSRHLCSAIALRDRISTTEQRNTRCGWELIDISMPARVNSIVVTINHTFFYYILSKKYFLECGVANIRIPDTEALSALQGKDFDEICSEVTEKIVGAYPNHSIILLGLCVNGRVALNVATQLRGRGAAVSGVAMLDCWAPLIAHKPIMANRLLQNFMNKKRRWTHYAKLYLSGKINTTELAQKNRFVHYLVNQSRNPGSESGEESHVESVMKFLISRSKGFKFSRFDGVVLLFKTEAASFRSYVDMFGWSGVISEDTPVYPIPGWHEDAMSNTGFEKVANIIRRRLLTAAPPRSLITPNLSNKPIIDLRSTEIAHND